jgi:hypothetical protein
LRGILEKARRFRHVAHVRATWKQVDKSTRRALARDGWGVIRGVIRPAEKALLARNARGPARPFPGGGNPGYLSPHHQASVRFWEDVETWAGASVVALAGFGNCPF